MQIDYTKRFLKQYAKLSNKLQRQTEVRIKLWRENPELKMLHDHALSGKYDGYRSIDITGDLRALYRRRGNTIIIFAFIGTHSGLY